jgi:hypothetical protein
MSDVESNQTNPLEPSASTSGIGHLLEHFKGNQLQYLIAVLIAAQMGWLDTAQATILGVCM